MQILYRGAESIIYKDEFEGSKCLVKERIQKKYRLDQIDSELRKTRTRKEVKLLNEARKFGVNTPAVLHVDENKSKIVMELVEGTRMKEYLNSASDSDVKKICVDIGKVVGKLHANGIVHGDLTTSNMILKDGKIFLIDFGLGEFSKRIEDQGVDLNLLQEAFKSTHYKILNLVWENILKGYKQEYTNADEVLRKVEEIEKRARYAQRE